MADPSLSELVAAVISDSALGKGSKYFRPPPESRYISNRNVYSAEGPMAATAAYERPAVPTDIQLDSTSCFSNFDPPIIFVSLYI